MLASTKARTPDPRQKTPPKGKLLLIDWSFSRPLKNAEIHLDLLYGNFTKELRIIPMPASPNGEIAFSLTEQEEERLKGILTYKATIYKKGETTPFKEYSHPLFVHLIETTEPLFIPSLFEKEDSEDESEKGERLDNP